MKAEGLVTLYYMISDIVSNTLLCALLSSFVTHNYVCHVLQVLMWNIETVEIGRGYGGTKLLFTHIPLVSLRPYLRCNRNCLAIRREDRDMGSARVLHWVVMGVVVRDIVGVVIWNWTLNFSCVRLTSQVHQIRHGKGSSTRTQKFQHLPSHVVLIFEYGVPDVTTLITVGVSQESPQGKSILEGFDEPVIGEIDGRLGTEGIFIHHVKDEEKQGTTGRSRCRVNSVTCEDGYQCKE